MIKALVLGLSLVTNITLPQGQSCKITEVQIQEAWNFAYSLDISHEEKIKVALDLLRSVQALCQIKNPPIPGEVLKFGK